MLLRHDLLAFLPCNIVRHQIETGEVVELDVAPASPIEPLGLLLRESGMPDAAERFLEAVRGHFILPMPSHPPLRQQGVAASRRNPCE